MGRFCGLQRTCRTVGVFLTASTTMLRRFWSVGRRTARWTPSKAAAAAPAVLGWRQTAPTRRFGAVTRCPLRAFHFFLAFRVDYIACRAVRMCACGLDALHPRHGRRPALGQVGAQKSWRRLSAAFLAYTPLYFPHLPSSRHFCTVFSSNLRVLPPKLPENAWKWPPQRPRALGEDGAATVCCRFHVFVWVVCLCVVDVVSHCGVTFNRRMPFAVVTVCNVLSSHCNAPVCVPQRDQHLRAREDDVHGVRGVSMAPFFYTLSSHRFPPLCLSVSLSLSLFLSLFLSLSPSLFLRPLPSLFTLPSTPP